MCGRFQVMKFKQIETAREKKSLKLHRPFRQTLMSIVKCSVFDRIK